MPNGIDYRLISQLGGAKARGASQALQQQTGIASLQDYMAQTGAKTAIGGEAGLPGYYEQELRKESYTKDVQSKMPFIQQMIAVGDKEGLNTMNQGLANTYGTDLHTTELTNLVPGQFAEMTSTLTGADIMAKRPELAGKLNDRETYSIQTRMPVEGQAEVFDIKPTAPTKAPTAEKVIETGTGFWQWNPETDRYDIKAGPPKSKAGAPGAAEKWQKDSLAALKTLYGTQTEMGIVVDPARMAEYQDAMTYLADYKTKGLTANDAAVLSSRRSQAGGVDPIESVIQRLRGEDKSDIEIKKLLRASQFKSINPRLYDLK